MRATGVLVACAMALQGCVLSTAMLAPMKTQTDVLDRKGRAEIRSLPAGATVRDADGNVFETPARVGTRYQVRRIGRKHRVWMMITAVTVSVTIGTLAVAIRDPDTSRLTFQDEPLLDAVGWVFLLDAIMGARIGATWGRQNLEWKKRARYEKIATPNELTVEWAGWAPVKATIEYPEQSFATVRRPTLGTFDEALIHWERTSGLTPSPIGAFELGNAYARLVRAGGVQHRAKAIHYYETFLATGEGSAEQRAHATEQLATLRANGGSGE